ncbi:MAG: endonuclease/exonuclease/phosphatase family protein [Elusimicrobia bacterium]|nr:endonuclease/exonuclease/phosphatase family protein [Elusimicrobiota bacterium]
MELLTFNCSALPLLTPDVDARLDLLARELRRLDPDLACLQELGLSAQVSRLAARLSAWPYGFWQPRWPGLVAGGLALFSKRPLRGASFHPYAEQCSWLGPGYLSRLAVKGWMRLDLGDPGPVVLHTHLMADYGASRRTWADYRGLQERQAAELASFAARDLAAGRRVVVAGDLNATPASEAFGRLTGLGLRDALGGSAEPSMVPESSFPRPWAIPRRLERLDYVLDSAPGARGFWTLDEVHAFGSRRMSLSDHRGLLAHLA